MIIRKCKHCGKDVEVESKCATIVSCSTCLEKIHGQIKEKRAYDTDDFIYCRICNTVKKRIDCHLKSDHDCITAEQYLEKYPDAPIYSKNLIIKKRSRDEASCAITSEKSKLTWQNEDYRKSFSLKRTGQKHKTSKKKTEQQITNLKNGIENSPKMKARRERGAQKAILREQNERLEKEQLKEFVLCPLCLREGKDEIDARLKFLAPKHITDTHNYTLGQFHKEFPIYQFKTEALCIEHSESLSGENHFNYGKHLSEETCQKIFESNKEFLQNNDFGFNGFSYDGVRKDIGYYTRSMIEANFCRILIYNNIEHIYEPTLFKLKHSIHTGYIPDILLLQDFCVWKAGNFIEIKGKFPLDPFELEKMQVFQDQYPNEKLVILHSKSPEKINLERQFKRKIPLWENTIQNIKTMPSLYIKDYAEHIKNDC